MKSKNSKLKTQNLKLKFKTFYFLLVFLPFAFCLLPFAAQSAAAQEMKNGFYIIQMGNLNSIAGISGSEDYKINITSGELAPNLNVGTNYKVRAGFQYIPRRKFFTIAVSNSLIDFGTLSPTNPVARTTMLTIWNTTAPQFKVTAAENHQLRAVRTGAIIPDTTCDSGSCNQTSATAWANTLTYGFGYRCDAIVVMNKGVKSKGCVPSDLTFYFRPTYYKQFADASKSEPAVIVMSGTTGNRQRATITYKVNIPSSQPAGVYTNAITYILSPNF